MVELTAEGTLELKQFWPSGQSDADTAKVVVTRFTVRDLPDGLARETHVFDGAKVKGSGGTKPVLTAANKLTVRFQGIDAPELHYRAAPLKGGAVSAEIRAKYNGINKDFRQPLGETATVSLSEFLSKAGTDDLPCKAVTLVEKPNDVFDTYGRFIGDIVVRIDDKDVDINHWLVETGRAFPTFYNSMSPDEITALRNATAVARANKALLWKNYTGKVGTLDMDLIFRKDGEPDPEADKGPVLMPKLFRRLTAWTVAKKAGVPGTPTTFAKMLDKNATADAFFLTDDFLEHGTLSAEVKTFPMFFENGEFSLNPDDLVFREAKSKLLGADGKPVEDWD